MSSLFHITRLTPLVYLFFLKDTAPTVIYTLSLHDALPIYGASSAKDEASFDISKLRYGRIIIMTDADVDRSEEHTSELQSRGHLVCRLLLEKKKKYKNSI